MKILLILLLLINPAFAYKTAPTNKAQINYSFAPIVKKVAPAVINIYTRRNSHKNIFMNDPFFEQFFGQKFNHKNSNITTKPQTSLGSGVIINKNGIVVTSNHVIHGSSDIVAILADGREIKAKIILEDKASDLAILQLETTSKNLPYIDIINSDNLEVGDLVLAIGNPFGVGQSVTSGIISALARSARGVSDYQFFIQTDAAINPGNSGGALVDINGNLVGINTAIFSKTGQNIGIGFAIPSNMVKAVLREIKSGNALKPWLGATMQDVNKEIANSLGLKIPKGVLIRKIFKESPADKAGLRAGDVITHFANKKIDNYKMLKFRIAIAEINKEISLKIIRKNKILEKFITPTQPPKIPLKNVKYIDGNNPLSGLTIANISPRLAMEMGIDMENYGVKNSGVIVIKSTNNYSRFAITKGDIITYINKTKINNTKQLQQIIQKYERKNNYDWRISYKRNGQIMNLRIVQ